MSLNDRPDVQMLAAYCGGIGGLKVVIVRDRVEKVRRTWRERLFSRPWRPLQKFREVVYPALMPPKDYCIAGGILYCGVEAWEALKREIALRGVPVAGVSGLLVNPGS